MAYMNYFNFNKKNLTNFLKWKSVLEIHVITKSTVHLDKYNVDCVTNKLLIFSNLINK